MSISARPSSDGAPHAIRAPGRRAVPARLALTALAFALAALPALACAGAYEAGEALLPTGMARAVVPSVPAASYVYVNTGGPVMLPLESFGPSGTDFTPGAQADDVLRASEATLFVGRSSGGFGGIFDFYEAGDAVNALVAFRIGTNPERSWASGEARRLSLAAGEPGWTGAVEDASRLADYVRLDQHPTLPWELVTNLPARPPSRPVAAGVASLENGLSAALYNALDLDLSDIDTAFALLRVDVLGFAIYTDEQPLTLPERLDRQSLEDPVYGVLMVSRSDYSGVMAAFMLGVVADRAQLETIPIGNTNARYGTIDGLHLLIKNRGTLVFAALSADKQNAIDLILSAVNE